MDAVFFMAKREDASRVTSSSDLPSDPAGDPLHLADPSPLFGLAKILGAKHPVQPLRDATCRSFPVWDLGLEISLRIAALEEAEIDEAAACWHTGNAANLDADPYDLACCLADLQEAIRESASSETLFVLLEERAW